MLISIRLFHYSDDMMSAMASPITVILVVCKTVCSGADQCKHQSFVSLAFVRRIHQWPVNSPHTGTVTRKMFPFYDVIMREDMCLDLVHKMINMRIFKKIIRVVKIQGNLCYLSVTNVLKVTFSIHLTECKYIHYAYLSEVSSYRFHRQRVSITLGKGLALDTWLPGTLLDASTDMNPVKYLCIILNTANKETTSRNQNNLGMHIFHTHISMIVSKCGWCQQSWILDFLMSDCTLFKMPAEISRNLTLLRVFNARPCT